MSVEHSSELEERIRQGIAFDRIEEVLNHQLDQSSQFSPIRVLRTFRRAMYGHNKSLVENTAIDHETKYILTAQGIGLIQKANDVKSFFVELKLISDSDAPHGKTYNFGEKSFGIVKSAVESLLKQE
jgi:hypothetical protein